MSRCSSVCGITPSSAATTNSTRSMPCAPASMFLMNRSWPGTSTTPARVPSGSVSSAKAQVDRDAALLLFLEAVGILAGQRFDERRLAVIDVPGRADDEGHQWRGTNTAGSNTPRRSRRKRFSWTRPRIGGRAARKRAAIASGPCRSWPIAITFVGRASVGSAPLPISDRESASSISNSAPSACRQQRDRRSGRRPPSPRRAGSASETSAARAAGRARGDRA